MKKFSVVAVLVVAMVALGNGEALRAGNRAEVAQSPEGGGDKGGGGNLQAEPLVLAKRLPEGGGEKPGGGRPRGPRLA